MWNSVHRMIVWTQHTFEWPQDKFLIFSLWSHTQGPHLFTDLWSEYLPLKTVWCVRPSHLGQIQSHLSCWPSFPPSPMPVELWTAAKEKPWKRKTTYSLTTTLFNISCRVTFSRIQKMMSLIFENISFYYYSQRPQMDALLRWMDTGSKPIGSHNFPYFQTN